MRSGSDEIQNYDGSLTTREREVLELVRAGLAEEQIADSLSIAHSTVGLLLRSAMRKLDARTRVEAAAKLVLPAAGPDPAEPPASRRPGSG